MHTHPAPISRRQLLQLGAVACAAGLAACATPIPPLTPRPTPIPTGPPEPTGTPTPEPLPAPTPSLARGGVLYRDGALADGRSATLQRNTSILVEPADALASATWRGGELIGEEEAGVIRAGGPAEFFLIHGDPLSDPAATWRVWRTAWERSPAI